MGERLVVRRLAIEVEACDLPAAAIYTAVRRGLGSRNVKPLTRKDERLLRVMNWLGGATQAGYIKGLSTERDGLHPRGGNGRLRASTS